MPSFRQVEIKSSRGGHRGRSREARWDKTALLIVSVPTSKQVQFRASRVVHGA